MHRMIPVIVEIDFRVHDCIYTAFCEKARKTDEREVYGNGGSHGGCWPHVATKHLKCGWIEVSCATSRRNTYGTAVKNEKKCI